MWTSMASGSVTLIVIVAGIESVFLRSQSVQRPTVMTPSSVATSVTLRNVGVPPSETGGSSGTWQMTVVPAPGPAEGSTVGATGLREQLVRKSAMVVTMAAL